MERTLATTAYETKNIQKIQAHGCHDIETEHKKKEYRKIQNTSF
jgi:hypothetical protein